MRRVQGIRLISNTARVRNEAFIFCAVCTDFETVRPGALLYPSHIAMRGRRKGFFKGEGGGGSFKWDFSKRLIF